PRSARQSGPLRLAEDVRAAGVRGLSVRRGATHAGAHDRILLLVLDVHDERPRHAEKQREDGDHAGDHADDDDGLDLRRQPVAPEPGREAGVLSADAVLHGAYSARLLSVSHTSTLQIRTRP